MVFRLNEAGYVEVAELSCYPESDIEEAIKNCPEDCISWTEDQRPLKNGTFYPISASGSNFNPRNIPYIPVVEIFTFLELKQKLPFFKGLEKK